MAKKEYCLVNGKRRYPTQEKALDHLIKIRRHKDEYERIPTRTYECIKCGGWHLTSQTESERSYSLRNEEFKKFLVTGEDVSD